MTIEVSQRWNFIFEKPPEGIRKIGSAQLLINTVNGILRPFILKDYEIDDRQVIYRLVPDDGYEDDPDLELELMPEYIDGILHKFVIIIEEVN